MVCLSGRLSIYGPMVHWSNWNFKTWFIECHTVSNLWVEMESKELISTQDDLKLMEFIKTLKSADKQKMLIWSIRSRRNEMVFNHKKIGNITSLERIRRLVSSISTVLKYTILSRKLTMLKSDKRSPLDFVKLNCHVKMVGLTSVLFHKGLLLFTANWMVRGRGWCSKYKPILPIWF